MRNQVQLIAYADRLGGSLPGLARLLDGPLAGLFGGVHVLPFFVPYDGADAGFDPVDHLTVDPRLGSWEDVRRLGRSLDTVADLIVNHVSDRSVQFRDVVERGERSPYAGMFLTYDRVFPAGAPCRSRRSSSASGSGWPGPRSPATRSTWTCTIRSPAATCPRCCGGSRRPASRWSAWTRSATR